MAKCQVTMPDELMGKFKNLGSSTEDIIKKTLQTGGEVVLSAAKSKLSTSIGSGIKYESRSTGELASHMGLTPVKVNTKGISNIKIGFAGKRNAIVGNVLEYGKHGQPAKPFMRPAKSSSEAACKAAMVNAFDNAVAGIIR